MSTTTFPTGSELTIADLFSLQNKVTKEMLQCNLTVRDETGQKMCQLVAVTEIRECPEETRAHAFLVLLKEWARFHDDLHEKVSKGLRYGHLPAKVLQMMDIVFATGAMILTGLAPHHEKRTGGEELDSAIVNLGCALQALEILRDSYSQNPDDEALAQMACPAA